MGLSEFPRPLSFPKEDIESRAKENLSVIGDMYRYE